MQRQKNFANSKTDTINEIIEKYCVTFLQFAEIKREVPMYTRMKNYIKNKTGSLNSVETFNLYYI